MTDFQGNHPRWCFYLLRTISKADHATKAAVPGVDRKDLYEICVPRPPQHEQIEIVVVLEHRLQEVDKSIGHAQRHIELLREYRARLIADVVTGKVDVRGVELPALDDADALEEWETGEDAGADEMDEIEGVDI